MITKKFKWSKEPKLNSKLWFSFKHEWIVEDSGYPDSPWLVDALCWELFRGNECHEVLLKKKGTSRRDAAKALIELRKKVRQFTNKDPAESE